MEIQRGQEAGAILWQYQETLMLNKFPRKKVIHKFTGIRFADNTIPYLVLNRRKPHYLAVSADEEEMTVRIG